MRISELITQLEALRLAEGDLDVIHRQGEMDDPYGISEVKAINADRRVYGKTVTMTDYYIPWDDDAVTNARVVELA